MSRFRLITLTAAAMAWAGTTAHAQLRASERATVSQTVDGTTISIDYARPQLRGREQVFGKIVPPEEVWTPGANFSTTLRASKDITIDGRPLPAGKYSVWLVTKGPWTMYFHRDTLLFHTRGPKPETMALGVPVTAREGERTEMLTFDFPRVSTTGMELRFRWGTTVIPLQIGVEPTMKKVLMADADAARYTGSWLLTYGGGPGGRSKPVKFEIINARGALRGLTDEPKDPMAIEFLPTDTPNKYQTALLKDGKIFDIELMTPTYFEMVNDRAVSFTVGRGPNPWMQGTRAP